MRLSARLLHDPVHFFALGGGAGLAPRAPGTAGTLVALPFAWLMLEWPLEWRFAVVVAVCAAGIALCGASARRLGVHDHSGIVLDEIAAFLALSLVLDSRPGMWLLAFVLFRVFDIAKPWPIRDVDHRLHGGLGIMLDDLMAAAYAAACLLAIDVLLAAT